MIVSDGLLFCPRPFPRPLYTKAILKDVDSLLYVDTDVLFLRPVDDIWKLLRQFNSTQLAAMAPEHEIPKIGWYSRFARHPFYGSAGVNSGVMLMNLTRIRSTQFKVRKNLKMPAKDRELRVMVANPLNPSTQEAGASISLNSRPD